jgi:hypothetical protein
MKALPLRYLSHRDTAKLLATLPGARDVAGMSNLKRTMLDSRASRPPGFVHIALTVFPPVTGGERKISGEKR